MTASRFQIRSLLRRVFGLQTLRPGQQAVIDAVLAGRHTLAIMPTGAGKSLCYQVPALLLPGMTVVISPLIALMRDQLEKLTALGIEAVQVNSAIPAGELRRARAKLGRRSVEFLFTTPEQLAAGALGDVLTKTTVDLVVIDEAHCISQWGHDFRPAYLDAIAAMRVRGTPAILALTATAPPDVIDDITRQLDVGPLEVINTGAYRANLHYQVRPVANDADKQRQLIDAVRGIDGAVIVYAATVRHVDAIARLFAQEGIDAVSYHGRMRAGERGDAQDRFMRGAARVIVATNAFGMGIDRADIRGVVHYDLPASLDVYYQESGRAGRDGEPADCLLLFQRGDRNLQTFFMTGRYPTHADFQALCAALSSTAELSTVTLEDIRASVPQVSAAKIRVMLTVLKQAGLIRQRRGSSYEIGPGLAAAALDQLAGAYDERRERDRGRLEQMVVYAQTALCRTRLLLAALGEEVSWERCGRCDNCAGEAVRGIAPAAGAA